MRVQRTLSVLAATAAVSAAFAPVAITATADELLPEKTRCVLTVDFEQYVCFYAGVGYTVDPATKTVVVNSTSVWECDELTKPYALALCNSVAPLRLDIDNTGATVGDPSVTLTYVSVRVPRVCVLDIEPCVGDRYVDVPVPNVDVTITAWVDGRQVPVSA